MEDINHTWREKDGKYIHDGDCMFWDRKICTCGLIHALAPLVGMNTEMYHGDYYKDQGQQQHVLDYLLRNPPEPMHVPTPEEQAAAKRLLEEHFGFKIGE